MCSNLSILSLHTSLGHLRINKSISTPGHAPSQAGMQPHRTGRIEAGPVLAPCAGHAGGDGCVRDLLGTGRAPGRGQQRWTRAPSQGFSWTFLCLLFIKPCWKLRTGDCTHPTISFSCTLQCAVPWAEAFQEELWNMWVWTIPPHCALTHGATVLLVSIAVTSMLLFQSIYWFSVTQQGKCTVARTTSGYPQTPNTI